MSLLSEFEATPQKGTVGSHMRKNKQQIEMIHINDIRPNKLNFFHINEEDVKSLADEGIGIVESVDEMENGKIIIRSHGVGPSIYDAIKAKGLELADATCPHVKKAQMSAKTLADEGFKVIIIGEKNHPEVKSIKEWAGKNSLVIGSQEEAENIAFVSKLGIVAQTTFSAKAFSEIVNILLTKSYDIRILRTICTATDKRQ